MAKLDGRPVLVTGAGGFIGGRLAARLVEEGARVRGLVRYNSRGDRGTLGWLDPAVSREIEVVSGELRDVESVARAVEGVEVVFHLGAQIAIPYSYVNPRDYFEVNALGSLNVAQAALRHGVAARDPHVDERGLRHARAPSRSPRSTRSSRSRRTRPARSPPTS